MEQQWRQGDGGGEIEGLFEGEWVHLASVGGVSRTYPDAGWNTRYRAWRDEALALMLLAPEMIEALELAEIADLLSDPDHDSREAIQALEARGDHETGWLDRERAAREYRYRAVRKRRAVIAKAKRQAT